jgi:hypothetical protein
VSVTRGTHDVIHVIQIAASKIYFGDFRYNFSDWSPSHWHRSIRLAERFFDVLEPLFTNVVNKGKIMA